MANTKKISTFKSESDKKEVEKLTTKSEKIRWLYIKGYSTGDIYRLLNLNHYQHARNVIEAYEKKKKNSSK